MKDNNKGIIYCMSTIVPGLVKIGKTGTDNFKKRMHILEHNGYNNVTGLKKEFAIEVDDYDSKELLLHDVFGQNRVGDTELFAIDLELVIQLLSSLEGNQIYPENKTKNEVFEQATNVRDIECIPDGKYYYVNTPKRQGKVKKKYKAILEKQGNTLTLLAGSDIVERNNLSSDKWSKIKNNMKIENNKLLINVKCESLSMAASLVSGTHLDGWGSWKTEDGMKINTYRK